LAGDSFSISTVKIDLTELRYLFSLLRNGTPKSLPFSNHLLTEYPWKRSLGSGKMWMYLESVDASGTEKTHKGERKT
jgi:hypothetical protein